MELTEALLTRRSRQYLLEPAPSGEELIDLIRQASSAPDHGLLRPWRWVLLRGAQRDALGAALASTVPEDVRDRAAAKPLRAPLLASIIFAPRTATKVPEWEQLAAVSALVTCLELLLHDRGWGSIWRTGETVASPAVREFLQLRENERLLGWLYIGTPDPRNSPTPRKHCSITDRVSSV
ncbi:nitroreductase [Streptomyces sp. Amel2xB2]|uniref:nitroreductase family protein n=1 Tax=Streptomyces sp. Amel2xB2 TaxID=1305829 RepID=UPI000DB90EC9|nr:nitroreductase [Streptomyces sp. Amel2xB2]RAJ58359.1 nitroreductase [Streptomyces sp. Amel2xB2]